MKTLIIPIFSMRSYTTGKYAILKDGNFQLSLARALASDFDSITISVPEDSSDFDEIQAKVSLLSNKITLQKFKYGINAVDTRRTFWELNKPEIKECEQFFDILISDITGYKGSVPVVFNFNITKLPELERPYIDEFFDSDIESIRKSIFTTVLNLRQREYILEHYPELSSKILVNTKCAHELLLPKTVQSGPMFFTKKIIFWPFRLSDKSYKWKEFLKIFSDQELSKKGYSILVTDPNESSKDSLPDFVSKISPSKEEYYSILSKKPIVVMLDDIDTVLHPGTIEFFHFGCPVITLNSSLIFNPNAIFDLENISNALSLLVYNHNIDLMNNFVYEENELDKFYNKGFIDANRK